MADFSGVRQYEMTQRHASFCALSLASRAVLVEYRRKKTKMENEIAGLCIEEMHIWSCDLNI
jgi:hypothetical protein